MKTTWEIIRQAVRQWQQDGALMLAAALAFYSAISLAPLVTMSIWLASAAYGEEALRGELVWQVERYVGPAGAEVAQQILANARERRTGFLPVFSMITLMIGASAVFVQLQRALNAIWNVAPNPARPWAYTLKVRFLAVLLVLGTGALLLAFTAGGAVLSAVTSFNFGLSKPGKELLWQTINFFVGVGVFTLLIAALFRFLPDAIIQWRDLWVGALATSALFNFGRLAIGVYLGNWAPGSAYGTVGSLIAVLLWIYGSGLILLLGAEFTQVYARRFGTGIEPGPHARRVTMVMVQVDDEGNMKIGAEERAEVKEHVSQENQGS